jgi:hypothetical protein
MIRSICADRAVAATVAVSGGRYKSDGEKIRIVSEKKFAVVKSRSGVRCHSTETLYRAIAARSIAINAITIKISPAFVLMRGRIGTL